MDDVTHVSIHLMLWTLFSCCQDLIIIICVDFYFSFIGETWMEAGASAFLSDWLVTVQVNTAKQLSAIMVSAIFIRGFQCPKIM